MPLQLEETERIKKLAVTVLVSDDHFMEILVLTGRDRSMKPVGPPDKS